MESLGFDPDAEGRAPAAVAEHRKAVAAYDGARQLLPRPSDGWRDGKVRRIVRAGRMAADRLDGIRSAPRDIRSSTPATPRDTFIDALGPLDRLALLMPGPTHLVVDSPAPGGWSVELLRLDQVPVVGRGALGKGASVLYHPGELPLDLTFEISSKYVWFLPLSATTGNRLTTGPDGNGDSRRALTVPARCLVVPTVVDQGAWSFGQRRPGQAAR